MEVELDLGVVGFSSILLVLLFRAWPSSIQVTVHPIRLTTPSRIHVTIIHAIIYISTPVTVASAGSGRIQGGKELFVIL